MIGGGNRHGLRLIAAIAWGASAVAATMAARQVGVYVAVLSAQALGLVLLLLLAVFVRPSLASIHGAVAVGLAGAGLVGLVGYLAFYRALADGPVGWSVRSARRTAGSRRCWPWWCSARCSAARARPVRCSRWAASRWRPRGRLRRRARRRSPPASHRRYCPGATAASVDLATSIPFAFASALAYGVGGFLLGDYSARAGWLAAALIAHGCSVAVLLVALPFLGRPAAWRGTASGVLWAAAAGIADAVGLLAFSRGGQVGQVAVTAAVSSIYPVIPVIAGMMLFSERLSGRQVLGVGGIVAGLVLLGLTG
jgi:drug/metabolite transporter (DMT)-like permease